MTLIMELCVMICRIKYIFYIYFRWPHLKKICLEMMPDTHLDFEELAKVRMKCSKQLRRYLAQMNKKWFHKVDKYLTLMYVPFLVIT